jgi:hypothetical protein
VNIAPHYDARLEVIIDDSRSMRDRALDRRSVRRLICRRLPTRRRNALARRTATTEMYGKQGVHL